MTHPVGNRATLGLVATALAINPAIVAAVLWLAEPRIGEFVVRVIESPNGQLALCGADDCTPIYTSMAGVPPRVEKLEADLAMLVAANLDARMLALEAQYEALIETMRSPGACTSRPSSIDVENAAPGDWTRIEIAGVCRIRPSCGVPERTLVVVGGDGLYHSAESEFRALPQQEGQCDDVAFRFRIPASAAPGRARLIIGESWPDADPWAPDQTISEPFVVTRPPDPPGATRAN